MRVFFYPQAEAHSEELVRTHLGPRPVAELLAVLDRQHGLVLAVVEGRASALQDGLLLQAEAGAQHRQQGRHGQQGGHGFRRQRSLPKSRAGGPAARSLL